MSTLFKAATPNGKVLKLTNTGWSHICTVHPELQRELEKANQTIKSPDFIKQGNKVCLTVSSLLSDSYTTSTQGAWIGLYEPFKYRYTEEVTMVTRTFTVVLDPAEEGGFVVKCLELPIASQGETREEALANIKEAIEGYLEVKAELFKNRVKGEKVEVVVEAPFAILA